MFQNLSIFQAAGGLARHAAARQNVLARNLANADTPGYQARDLAPFVNSFSPASETRPATPDLRVSNSKHLTGPARSTPALSELSSAGEQKPNGNTVSVEMETLKAVEAERAHARALAIYQHSLNLIKSSIGKGR